MIQGNVKRIKDQIVQASKCLVASIPRSYGMKVGEAQEQRKQVIEGAEPGVEAQAGSATACECTTP